jgi:hypothetical protein
VIFPRGRLDAESSGRFHALCDRAWRSGLYVYHYNHYEPTSLDHLTELHGTRQEAVGRLMGRFATREDDVDDLFRLGVRRSKTGPRRRGRPDQEVGGAAVPLPGALGAAGQERLGVRPPELADGCAAGVR